MRPEPVTIQLGDEEFKLRPLTLAQVRKIEQLVLSGKDKTSEQGMLAWSIEVILIGLSRDFPDKKEDDIEATSVQIGEAVRQIMEIGGFKGPAQSGEMMPAPQTGTPSTES